MEKNTTEKILRNAKELTPEELEKVTGAGSSTIGWYCATCAKTGTFESPPPLRCPSCGSDAVMVYIES